MSLVLDRPSLRKSHNVIERVEPVQKPKCSPALKLMTPSYIRIDPPWWQIEITIRSCLGKMDDEFGEFCILSQLDSNTFVQTCVCFDENPDERIEWRIEWRITEANGEYTHYFAIDPSDNEGADTVENMETVILAFKAFYQNKGLPDSLTWKRLDI